MRIATWNVNSLKARMEAVEKWLARAEPDVLLMQETKLADADAPVMPFRMLGYELVHHGEGRWNGVGILTRVGAEDVITNFGDGPVRDSTRGLGGRRGGGGLRPVRRGADGVRRLRRHPRRQPVRPERPGRRLAVLRGQAALVRARRRAGWPRRGPTDEPLVLGGDYNVTPAPEDVWSEAKAHGGTHVSPPERAALATLREWGLADTYRSVRPETGPLLVVGLPGRHVPSQRGHAHRPAVRDRAGRGARRLGRDRPRGAQGPADAVRPRAGRRSTSTSPASRSTPAGRAPSSGSRHGRSPAVSAGRAIREGREYCAGPRPSRCGRPSAPGGPVFHKAGLVGAHRGPAA